MPLLRPRVKSPDLPASDSRISVNVPAEGDSSPLKAILGWIPTEVITAYKAGIGFIPLSYPSWRLWVSIIGIGVTFLWIIYATRPDNSRIAWRQAIISPIAFCFWVTAIEPDVMKTISADWQIWMGSLLLAGGMLMLPIINGILRSLGVRPD